LAIGHSLVIGYRPLVIGCKDGWIDCGPARGRGNEAMAFRQFILVAAIDLCNTPRCSVAGAQKMDLKAISRAAGVWMIHLADDAMEKKIGDPIIEGS
jgi:hypothetical protein